MKNLWMMVMMLAMVAGAEEKLVKAELLSEVEEAEAGSSFYVAVRLQMKKGWHTYWINPGDSGMESQINWQLPKGITAGEILWPTPKLYKSDDMVSYGYEGEVYLLVKLNLAADLQL